MIKGQQTKNVKKIKLFDDDYVEGIHLSVASMQEQEIAWFRIGRDLHQMDWGDKIPEGESREHHTPIPSDLFIKVEVTQVEMKQAAKRQKKP